MSLEPAAAALVGLIALSQSLSATEVVAIALVVVASAGALRSAATPAPRDGCARPPPPPRAAEPHRDQERPFRALPAQAVAARRRTRD